MADSKHQDIIDAFDARLKTIKTSAGYETNIGNNVYEDKAAATSSSKSEELIYKDLGEVTTTENAAIGYQEHQLSIEIHVRVLSGGTTSKQLRKTKADIYKAIGVDETWGGLAQSTELSGFDKSVEQAEQKIGAGVIKIQIIYSTPRWDPYT